MSRMALTKSTGIAAVLTGLGVVFARLRSVFLVNLSATSSALYFVVAGVGVVLFLNLWALISELRRPRDSRLSLAQHTVLRFFIPSTLVLVLLLAVLVYFLPIPYRLLDYSEALHAGFGIGFKIGGGYAPVAVTFLLWVLGIVVATVAAPVLRQVWRNYSAR